jgi:preprotein translocase subunit SecE
MSKLSPIAFMRQVRTEMKKVTWPSRQETTVSTFAVFLMVTFAAIFLFLADQVMAFIVRTVLAFGL